MRAIATPRRSPGVFLLVLVIAAVIGGAFWANLRFTRQNPGGNDFLVHWVGTRALILDGTSPYSEEVALEIQRRAYGRPARPGEHELRVAYPLYSTLIFSPFALIGDYELARALWMTALEAALVLIALTSLRLTDWRPGTPLLVVYFLFTLLWYHSVRPLINGNAVILVTLLVTLALLSIRTGRDEAAGLLLAFATIKPQVVVLLVLFVIFWALSHRRWLVAGWFFGTLAFLVVAMMIFIPDWIIQNFWEVLRYPSYNPPGTPAAVFALWLPATGRRLALVLILILAAILGVEWVLARGKDERWFLWTASLTLVVSQWIGIQTDPGNFIVLFPALVLIFAVLTERWGSAGRLVALISMLLLFAGLWALFLATVEYGDQPQQHPIMFFPLPFFVLLGLYWVRWWAIHPLRFWMDAIREMEA